MFQESSTFKTHSKSHSLEMADNEDSRSLKKPDTQEEDAKESMPSLESKASVVKIYRHQRS